jgi:hypothetical protein
MCKACRGALRDVVLTLFILSGELLAEKAGSGAF